MLINRVLYASDQVVYVYPRFMISVVFTFF
jgi:hypothetical protein